MANPKHLSQVLKGVRLWNNWRLDNPFLEIDLTGTNLEGANLEEADFAGVKLRNVNLRNSKLQRANLQGADLSKADLSGADLSTADLSGADLSMADLSGADLSTANLSRAHLEQANLQNVKFHRVSFQGANLSGADLSGADLEEANIQDVKFQKVNLQRANLQKLDLSKVDFREANLQEVNLQNSDLRKSLLQKSNITGAKLWGTARFGWEIDGIICDYIFFDEKNYVREPKNRDFNPGEFEKTYKIVPTVEIFFKKGMDFLDPALLAYIATESKESYPNLGLSLSEIQFKGLHPSAIFEIAENTMKKEAENFIPNRLYEIKKDHGFLQTLLGVYKDTMNQKDRLINNSPQTIINKLKEIESYSTKTIHNEELSKIEILIKSIEGEVYVPEDASMQQESKIDRFINSDKEVLDELYKQLYSYAKNFNVQVSDEEIFDLIQDTILYLYSMFRSGPSILKSSLGSYASTVFRNKLVGLLKKRYKGNIVEMNITGIEESFNQVKDNQFKLIEKAMTSLNERDVLLLKLLYQESKTLPEIASIMGFSNINSVRIQSSRALRKLKAEIEKYLQLNPLKIENE